MRILVTGGSGFIESALIRRIISKTDDEVINLDDLTYSSFKMYMIIYCKIKGMHLKKEMSVTRTSYIIYLKNINLI